MTSANIGYIGQTKKDVLATCTILTQTEMIFALLENGKKDEAMNKCDNCKADKVCDHNRFGFENCDNYISVDCVEVVYCKDCIYARELDKNCEINREYYKHCALWRGDETKNVWHKYKKYYKDYSLVEAWGYCSNGERKGGTE